MNIFSESYHPPTLPFTEAELKKAGLLGEGVSAIAARVIEFMKKHPGLLKISIFALECINAKSQQRKESTLPRLPGSRHATAVSEHAPDEYERTTYYNGITGDGDHPELVYRSDLFTTPFPKPVGRYGHVPVKSVHGVFNTPLNSVWDTVGPQVLDVIKARKIDWSSIDPARFFTHGLPGEDVKGSLGPTVIWVGVIPGSTSADTAHSVSQEILALLLKNGVEGVVVEWREAVPQRLAGPPLMRHVGSTNPTHHVRRFVTAQLGVPLATQEMEEEDVQGTLTLWFHENRDKDGNPSNKVYGVSNCHVLRRNTTVGYEHKGGAPMDHVRVCGMRRLHRGLVEITQAVADHTILADVAAREVVKLEAKEVQDAETTTEIRLSRRNLDDENQAIADLGAFHGEIMKHWSDIELYRNIGHVQYAAPITVDKNATRYTTDWAAFLVAEAKVKDAFEGNVVDLGSKYTPQALTAMFYPFGGSATTFKFPEQRKLRIEGCATSEDLANPSEIDNEGEGCFIVGKDGNTTDLTVGRYAGLVSFSKNEVGIESTELGIYNSSVKPVEVFSAKGDSGALVWHTKNGKAYIVGQLHSGENKGGLTSNHVTYCTPGWYLLDQIRKKFKYADFYRRTWSA